MTSQEYVTRDNGQDPFRVVIKGKMAIIYNHNKEMLPEMVSSDDSSYYNSDYDDSSEYEPEDTEIIRFKFKQVFIGKSPLMEMTKNDESWGSEYDGNTILFQIKDKTYVYVGDKILSFTAISEIIEYISPVGNNDVPYPYAIDMDRNIYLILEDIIIKHVPLSKTQNIAKLKEYDTPYFYYYNNNLIVNKKSHKLDRIPEFKNIKTFLVNNQPENLRFVPYPNNDYKYKRTKDNFPLSVLTFDGQKIELTKEDYVTLIHIYGVAKSFYPLHCVELDIPD